MSLLIPKKQKFLFDENVRRELADAFRLWRVGFLYGRKGAGDSELSKLSKAKKLVLITNDKDFLNKRRADIYGVILLKLPQTEPVLLVSSLKKVLSECKKFSGQLIIIEKSAWISKKLAE